MTCATFDDAASAPVLESRYEIVGAPIGAGAVGIVYAARDVVLGIDVAIKVMRDDYATSAPMFKRPTLGRSMPKMTRA